MLTTNKQRFGCDDYELPIMEMTFLFFSPNNIRRQLYDGLARKKTHKVIHVYNKSSSKLESFDISLNQENIAFGPVYNIAHDC